MPRLGNLFDDAKIHGRLWLPSLQSGCLCDLDGTALERMAVVSGEKLSGWVCRISGNSFSQATDSKRPVLYRDKGRVNGVGFTAASQTSLAFGTPITSSAFTALILTTERGTAQTQEPLYNGNSGTNGWGFLYNWTTDPNKIQAIYGAVAVLQATPSPRVVGSSYLSILSRVSTTNYFEVNGTSYTVSNSNFVTPANGISVGADQQFSSGAGAGWYDGIVHSVLIFNKALTDYERKRAAATMLWRHRMTSLIPATSPFKNRPPLIGD